MKKVMKNLTAVLLMAALVFSVIGVPDTAFAASSKITLKSGEAAPSIIYAGHSYSLKRYRAPMSNSILPTKRWQL